MSQSVIYTKYQLRFCWTAYLLAQTFHFSVGKSANEAGGQYPEPGSERDRVFSVRINDIQERARALIQHRRKTVQENPTTPTKFIDIVMDFGGDDESLIESDVVDYILAAYMSTGDREFSYFVNIWWSKYLIQDCDIYIYWCKSCETNWNKWITNTWLILFLAVMTWCFYLIGTHPEVEEKMYQEIMDVLGEDGQPTFENHRQLV